ncbi:type 2 lanthipeptide synthetase LanM family protein [Frisingicoccus sp.]|uniref:type 2 lanthipeptide synthetase LanM family protein n=1 Tax=Frisingicoccus sp. TaxID=1918627 RepID=UPI003AB67D99
MEEIVFKEFYEDILKDAVRALEKRMADWSVYVEDSVYSDFSEYLAGRLQSIGIRTLIAVMHGYKQNGMLEGGSPEAEYTFFCRKIIKNENFQKKVFQQFPVLRCKIRETVENAVSYYTEVIEWFVKDREDICGKLCPKAEKISEISGNFSDVHHRGKQVLKVGLNNGCDILFKPHSMENEQVCSRMLQWLGEKTGIWQMTYPFLSYPEHSWSSIVAFKQCETENQLENYYMRLGVQLFLFYVIGTKDLHYENIIASGEYPVVIDLETLVNIRYNRNRKTANEEIGYLLSQSVLYTGLLPFYYWNNEGKGVDISGMNGGKGQQYPFKVPRIIEAGTSNMRVAYEYPVSGKTQNQAMLNGEFYAPFLYKIPFLKGFTDAYEAAIDYREEFYHLIKKLQKTKSRYLVLDTQRYSMMLSSSWHPSLLVKEENRRKFFDLLWEGRRYSDREIVENEMESLARGDIPFFYYALNSRSLFTDDGKEIKGYFEETTMDILFQRLDRLDKSDMKRQCEFIETSFDLMSDKTERYLNKVYMAEKDRFRKRFDNKEVRLRISAIKERLLEYAVWNGEKTEVGWYSLAINFHERLTWSIHFMNVYLYDGLAGMLVVMSALKQAGPDEEIERICHVLTHRLFKYTDEGVNALDNLLSKVTGAYTGESSIVYTYLVLYELSRECIYLEYAKRHMQIVENLLEEDTNYDLLSGNAGAAQVMLKLYEITGDWDYVTLAEKAVDILKKAAEKQEKGIGWTVKAGIAPMSGMAHGNAGIMMPVISLWKITGNRKYERLAEEIWQYEEYLYDEEKNNWMDVRKGEDIGDDIGPVAWCHGAGGILLSRLKCLENVEDNRWKERFEKDIRRAQMKLKACWRRDSWSLCHGICGNLWMLGKTEKETLWLDEEIRLLPQEKINPGLMNGYGGILYYLLKCQIKELPDILSLD